MLGFRRGAEICLPRPAPAQLRRPWVASTPGVRQHRRLTWQQHLARYELRCIALPDYAASGSIRATMLKSNGTVRNISKVSVLIGVSC